MNKLKILLCSIFCCLIVFLSSIPKASAYSGYVSLNNRDTILFNTTHYVVCDWTLDNNGNSFGELELDYEYTIDENEDAYYLHIYGYSFQGNGYSFPDRDDISIELDKTVFDEIGTISEERQYIDYQYELLTLNELYISCYFEVTGTDQLTPYINIHDIEFNVDSGWIELMAFDWNYYYIEPCYIYDIPLELVHTTMLHETYLYNRYRIDGNSLSQLGEMSITEWLEDSIGGFFDTNLFGDFTIGDIVLLALSMGLLFMFLRFFVGG